MTAYAATAPPVAFTRPSLPRLTAVELRKMTDTRAGFWLLLITGFLAAAIVTITAIWGEAAGPEPRRDVPRRAVGGLGAAARCSASSP